MRSILGPQISALLFVALPFCASPAAALPVHVTFDWPKSTSASAPASVEIQAVRTAGPNAGAGSLQAQAGPAGVVLNLGDGVWRIEASLPGYWTQGAEVVVARERPPSARLAFWPAASLHGELFTSGGQTLPGALEVRLNATPASGSEITSRQTAVAQPAPGPPRAELHCPIQAGTWSCLAPAGVFDARLEAAGYAPRYQWAVSLKPAQTVEFGRTELLRTASVFGRVVRKDTSSPPGPCRATLRANLQRQGPAEPDQARESGPNANTSLSVLLNPRGYFQVVGVTPGSYVLAVGCKGASGFRELRVEADRETRIDPPLLLEELTLDISLTPKTDPAGQPWKLAVYETAPHFLLIAASATTSADGRWIRRGLMAGNYHIVVTGSDGTAWLEKYFDFGESTGPLTLRVGSLSVAGRVMMSSQPVHARLVFTNNAGGESATLLSDENGRFQGLLPVTNRGEESSWTVEAQVVQPPVTQRLLGVTVRPAAGGGPSWLELELPAIPVRGSVVSPDGKPQPGVQVTFEDSSGTRTSTGTDDAGRFEMLDLPPGKYTVVADSHDGASDRRPFEVVEGSGSELNLVLNPFKRIPFYVVSSQGPVAEATVQVWIKPGVPRAFARTDQDGRFEVTLPPGTTEVGLTIGAPGYAVKLTRLPISMDSDEPPEAHTITLDTTAGTLVLNFQPPGRTLDRSETLYLIHNGAIQDARTIAGWGTDQAGMQGDGPASIDAIEPGDYALCRITDPAQLASIWSGAPPSSRCRKGSLAEGETMTLSPQ